MTLIIPRYEFRIFGTDIQYIIENLKRVGKFQKERKISEIYLMTAGNTDNNIKIRNKNIDIKRLVENSENLEQWKPFNIGKFPLKTEIIKNDIFPSLGVEAPAFDKAMYTLEQFMKELIIDDPDIIVALTEKERFGYSFNNCICEYAKVKINGALIYSLSVESENYKDVEDSVGKLGMTNLDNINYPKQIKRVLGLEIDNRINKYL
ncbi:MAG: hypothetical protein DRI86_04735 [Bacteroidetes bacterium]|nr:MAG: hypothetical protein DRI86_04735 [Bacteroidota bacterium]